MKKFLTWLGLQFFAEAGTLTNVTGNTTANSYATNSYTGDDYAATTTDRLAVELKDFYDTELLENARVDMFYAQFGKRQPLPAGHKGTVEWRKWNTFDRASVLKEGVIPTGQRFGATNLTGSINQYGTYVSISDKLQLRSYDDVIAGATEEMGASAAETQEVLIRDALFLGTNVLYADKVTVATGAETAVTGAAGLTENSTYVCHLTPKVVNKAVTKMKKNKVPKINGKFYAVIHPSFTYDLRQSSEWIDFHKYAQPGEIYNGEIGELHGCRFIEDTFAPVLKGADLASDSRTLTINYGSGYSGAITSVAFDGGTVAGSALVGRTISINGVTAVITANTTSALTFASTNFGSISDNTVIYPADFGADDVAAYATYFFGKDSFGIIDPEGGALEMIVHDKDEIGGPLNQFSTIGYKFETNGATILYPERLLRVMSTSSYSTTDAAN